MQEKCRKRKIMYIEGKNAVISAIKNQKTINKILVDKNFSFRKDEIISLARQNKIKIEFLPRNILDKKSQTSHHQGYIHKMLHTSVRTLADWRHALACYYQYSFQYEKII